MQTDIVQLAHPLATQGSLWSGEVRRRSVVLSAGAPGLTVQLSLREFGSIRGVSETWEAPPVPPSVQRVQEPWDGLPVIRTLLETWEPRRARGTSRMTSLPRPRRCPASMRCVGTRIRSPLPARRQVHGAGGRVLDESTSTQTQAPAWSFANPQVSSGRWAEALVSPPALGRGTALYRHNPGGAEQVFVALERQSGTSEAWRLRLSTAESESQLFALPNGTQTWSMALYDFR